MAPRQSPCQCRAPEERVLVKARLREIGPAGADLEADAAAMVDCDVPGERDGRASSVVGLIRQVGHGCIIAGVVVVLEWVTTHTYEQP